MEIRVSERWRSSYPGASIGILSLTGAENLAAHPALEAAKRELASRLRAEFAGADRPALRSHPRIRPYAAYYSRFDKTYHVQLQLESVALKGKPLPTTAVLVDAMLMAELKNLLLTAGHDLAAVRAPLTIDAADGTEAYLRLDGREQALKPGDMAISDSEGVISCIVYGPDQRTRITASTGQVLYTVYAPAGISPEDVRSHLGDLLAFVRLASPGAEPLSLEVLRAG